MKKLQQIQKDRPAVFAFIGLLIITILSLQLGMAIKQTSIYYAMQDNGVAFCDINTGEILNNVQQNKNDFPIPTSMVQNETYQLSDLVIT